MLWVKSTFLVTPVLLVILAAEQLGANLFGVKVNLEHHVNVTLVDADDFVRDVRCQMRHIRL